MNLRVQKALNETKKVDEQGKIQIANLAHDNEVLLLRNSNLMFSLASSLMSGGGFGGSGFYELTRTIGIAGKTEKVACESLLWGKILCIKDKDYTTKASYL